METSEFRIDDSPVLRCNSVEVKDMEEVKKKLEELTALDFPTQYIFMNASLNMNSGKAAAQAAHAVEELNYTIFKYGDVETREKHLKMMGMNPRTTIVLEVENEDELYKLNSYLESQGIRTGIYVDESVSGKHFVPTAMAVEYLERASTPARLLSGMYKLFKTTDESLEQHLKDLLWLAENTYYEGLFFCSKRNLRYLIDEAKDCCRIMGINHETK